MFIRADMNRDTYSSMTLPKQRMVNEPHAPGHVTDVDRKCTCCPYGYHIDLDFLNFCHDLEAGSTLKNLWRIQRTKRNLRKSMELMLNAEEVILTDPSSASMDVVNSAKAERLLHMINYEQSASHRILRQIDSSVIATAASTESGGVWRRTSSDSDDTQIASTISHLAANNHDQSGLRNIYGPGLSHADSMTSLSSASSTFNEPIMVTQTEHAQTEGNKSVTSKMVVENPVLEMATAEIKHYSTTSSGELANGEANHLHTSQEHPVLEMATAEMKHYSATSSGELADSEADHLCMSQEHPVLEMATAEMKHYSSTYTAELADSEEDHLFTDQEHPVLEMATAEMKHYSTTSSTELADSGNQSVILENPVLEVATAEMKHYSTTSSAQLSDRELKQPGTKNETLLTHPSALTRIPATQTPRPSPDENETSIQFMREAMATSLQRIKVLEEQVKTIPVLQVRISVLKEEKRLMNLQLRASKASTRPLTNSIGVGDDSLNTTEEMEPSNISTRELEISTTKDDNICPQAASIKTVKTSSIGVGDHSVLEPYNLQPDLPTGYVLQENETTFEIHSRKFLEDEMLTTSRNQKQQLSISFQQTSSRDISNNRDQSPSVTHQVAPPSTTLLVAQISSQPNFCVSENQKNISKAVTRTIGTGDGNVFEDSKLQVHEKELRTVILGPASAPGKRNVGIECRPATRDVGVLFVCEEEKPETRTVGVNVNYDTTGIMTSLDFKGETQLRMALHNVLQRNVRSVGTNCILRNTMSETGTMTNFNAGVTVGCGDEEHRVDVEVRPAIVRKSASVAAKPDVGHKCISTAADWTLDASTNTVQINSYQKGVMTDKQQPMYASTNTDAVSTRPASNQTDKNIFISMNQVRHAGSNTEHVTRSCTGMSTDIITTKNAYVNTEKVSDLFHEKPIQKNVGSFGLQSLQRITETDDERVDVHILSGSKEIQAITRSRTSDVTLQEQIPAATPSRNSDVILQEQIIQKDSGHENAFLSKSEYTKKSSKFDSGNTHYSSLEISTRSSPLRQSHVSSQEDKISIQEDFDNRNSVLEIVPPASSDDKFSETVVEHYIITKDGKKLVSEEKITTSSQGTNRSFREYTDNIHQTTGPEISSNQRSYGECSIMQDSGSNALQRTDTVSSSRTTTEHESMVKDNSCVSEIYNQQKTEDNVTEGPSSLSSDTVDGGSRMMYQVFQRVNDEHTESGQNSSSKTNKVTSEEIFYDTRHIGSVEDFMPEDVRKYMCLDSSSSKNNAVDNKVVHRFSGGSSDATNVLSAETTSDACQIKRFNMSKTVTARSTNRIGEKTFIQKMGNDDGSGVHARTLTSESDDGQSKLSESTLMKEREQSEKQGQNVSNSASLSATSYSSRQLRGQGHSDSSYAPGASIEAAFTDKGFSNTNSCHKTATITAGTSEEMSAAAEGYTSMDRKPMTLKSIIKHRTDTQSSHKKVITFAETVTGGTGSSSEEDNNSSDSESTESHEKSLCDQQQSDEVYFCKYDETLTQDLPEGQMIDLNIREIYELSGEVKDACSVLATYLTDSTSIQTKELNSSQEIVKQEWFQLSGHKLSSAHQVEDFLSSVNSVSKRLLEYIVNMTDANGNTAIHYCISHCNFEIASLLLGSEVCDVNKRNQAGYTPIMLAGLATVQNQQECNIIKKILSFGDINARATSTEQTALMLAVSHGRTEMAKLLVEEGADINLQDEDGSTALMCACEHGHQEIVNFLLMQPSIDVNITDNEQSTALNIAMEAGHKNIGVILYKHLNFSKMSAPGSPKKRKSSSSPTQSNFGIR